MINNRNEFQLCKGDCLEIMKDIPDKSVDMILCDLPYAVNTTDCKWDKEINLGKLWIQYNRIIKDNGAIVLFGSQPFTSMLIMSNYKNYKHIWIWNKKMGANFSQVKRSPLKIHEDIVVFCNGKLNYNPQMRKGEMRVVGSNKTYNDDRIINITKTSKKTDMRYPVSILEYSNAGRTGRAKKLHPTQKPVELLEYLIRTYTNENEIVLDNTMGSGSTGVACLNANRKFIGIEKDDKYFEIAKERIKNTYKELDYINKQ